MFWEIIATLAERVYGAWWIGVSFYYKRFHYLLKESVITRLFRRSAIFFSVHIYVRSWFDAFCSLKGFIDSYKWGVIVFVSITKVTWKLEGSNIQAIYYDVLICKDTNVIKFILLTYILSLPHYQQMLRAVILFFFFSRWKAQCRIKKKLDSFV